LGCEDEDSKVGLEMYNAETGERAPELYDSSRNYTNFDPRSGDSEYGDTHQIFSSYPYIADFMMKYQPVMKIVEVPLYSKTLRVLDNPGNRLQVIPYQIDDDSQRLGFKFSYEFFSDRETIPSSITNADQDYVANYLHANDLTEDSILENETVAQPRTMEVYRLDQMPSSTNSFDGKLISTIDLKIQDDDVNTFKEAIYEDTVVANAKYYYLFRVLNQQNTISHVTEIYEAQLVNDGGYKYAVFNVINERELTAQNQRGREFSNFKKILQLQPNISQVSFDIENVDFGQEAGSQIENLSVGTLENLIWDKTFKIRLTSKKTGKKIDLNVTYKLNSE